MLLFAWWISIIIYLVLYLNPFLVINYLQRWCLWSILTIRMPDDNGIVFHETCLHIWHVTPSMEEILHQLIGILWDYLQGFRHPRWCWISFINSIILIMKLVHNFMEIDQNPNQWFWAHQAKTHTKNTEVGQQKSFAFVNYLWFVCICYDICVYVIYVYVYIYSYYMRYMYIYIYRCILDLLVSNLTQPKFSQPRPWGGDGFQKASPFLHFEPKNPTPTPTASPTQHTAKWGLCDELQQDDHHPAVWCYGTCDLFGRSHYSSSTTSHGKFDDDLHLGDQGWSQTEGMKKKFMILICTHYIYI